VIRLRLWRSVALRARLRFALGVSVAPLALGVSVAFGSVALRARCFCGMNLLITLSNYITETLKH
jgi:hypothetical protein